MFVTFIYCCFLSGWWVFQGVFWSHVPRFCWHISRLIFRLLQLFKLYVQLLLHLQPPYTHLTCLYFFLISHYNMQYQRTNHNNNHNQSTPTHQHTTHVQYIQFNQQQIENNYYITWLLMLQTKWTMPWKNFSQIPVSPPT